MTTRTRKEAWGDPLSVKITTLFKPATAKPKSVRSATAKSTPTRPATAGPKSVRPATAGPKSARPKTTKPKSVKGKLSVKPSITKKGKQEGKKELEMLKPFLRTALKINIPNTITRSGRKSVKKISFIDEQEITSLFNLYKIVCYNRSNVLNPDVIINATTDSEINEKYISKMEILFTGSSGKSLLSDTLYKNFREKLNFICEIGSNINSLLKPNKISTIQDLKNIFKNNMASNNLSSISNLLWSLIKRKNLTYIPTEIRGVILRNNFNIKVLRQNDNIKNILYDGNLENMLKFFSVFKETNDFIKTLDYILSSPSHEQEPLLRKSFPKVNNLNSLNILRLLRSRDPQVYRIPMSIPPYQGARHHVFSVASLKSYMKNRKNNKYFMNNSKVNGPTLNTLMFYLESLLLETKTSLKNQPLRSLADRSIIRQEPCLLKSIPQLENYMSEINKCSTAWRHGGIHCQLIKKGVNRIRGVATNNSIKFIDKTLQKMAEAYETNKSAFDYPEMYSLLRDTEYQAIYFDNKGIPIPINNDLDAQKARNDKHLSDEHFFQSFIYIINENKMPFGEIDILKNIVKSRNTNYKFNFNKKFAIQTTGENMKHLFRYIYEMPVNKVFKNPEILKSMIKKFNQYKTEKNVNLTSPEITRLIDELYKPSSSNKTNFNTKRKMQQKMYEVWTKTGILNS